MLCWSAPGPSLERPVECGHVEETQKEGNLPDKGSVPTLHDLLLPSASRSARFSVGRSEYDPKNVGYVSDGQVPFVVDTTLAGNSNRGYEFGTKLSEEDRLALVEYLKTL